MGARSRNPSRSRSRSPDRSARRTPGRGREDTCDDEAAGPASQPEVEPVPTVEATEAGQGVDRGAWSRGIVTVATVNINRYMGLRRINADRKRVLARRDVDVIGWQEADPGASFFADQPGWGTARHPGATGALVSWRLSVFEFRSSRSCVWMAPGQAPPVPGTRLSWPHRLPRAPRHWAQGHGHQRPHRPEDRGPGSAGPPAAEPELHWSPGVPCRRSPSSSDVLRGGHRDGRPTGTTARTERVRHPEFVLGSVGQYAQSSYEALGSNNVRPTWGAGATWLRVPGP